ncbi:MAG: hypothetical protein ABJN69_06845 [Hellea sp.]
MTPRKVFYHMSSNFFEVGKILTAIDKNIDYLGEKIGSTLEANRPAHCFSRMKTVFLSESEDFTGHGITEPGYAYRVKPLGKIQAYHNHWIGVLQKRHPISNNQKNSSIENYTDLTDDQIAKKYWDEIKGSEGNWEFLVENLEILECLTPHPVTSGYNSIMHKTLREVRNR